MDILELTDEISSPSIIYSSEYALLGNDLEKTILGTCHSQLKLLESQKETAMEAAQAIFDSSTLLLQQQQVQLDKDRKKQEHDLQSEFNEKQGALNKEFQAIWERAKALEAKFKLISEEAETHVLNQHLGHLSVATARSSLSLGASKNATHEQHLEHAKHLLDEVEPLFKDLKEVKRPEHVIWPDDAGVGLGVLFMILTISGVAAIIAKGNGENGSQVFFFFSIGLYTLFVFIINLIPILRIKSLYQPISSIIAKATPQIDTTIKKVEEQQQQQGQKITQENERLMREMQRNFEEKNEVLQSRNRALTEVLRKNISQAQQDFEYSIRTFEEGIGSQIEKLHARCRHSKKILGDVSSDWSDDMWNAWKPSKTANQFLACIGNFKLDVGNLSQYLTNLDLDFEWPALIPFDQGKCLLMKADGNAKEAATASLTSITTRLLATLPPGNVTFTLIDPVGLGQNVAPLLHLAEFDESLIRSRAWTEPNHIEQRLAELTEHMETVIQKYLRRDYDSIEEYNQQSKVKEPYRVLVIMDFPVNFNESAMRRLISIATNGPRCGVYTLILMDTNKPIPYGFSLSDLEQHAHVIKGNGNAFNWQDINYKNLSLTLDSSPDNDQIKRIVEKVGSLAINARKVEVPFDDLLEEAKLSLDKWWQESTARNLSIPLGPTGARKLQELTLGEGTAHHGLIVGRPGSGKTNLMHVIITALSIKYSPDELKFYLVDFKKGVGFKPYADFKLPHALAIAIESEREFGLSVLQGLDAEMQRRGELFRGVSVEDSREYRRKSEKPLPRLLLIVDEFQEFFTQDDSIHHQASILLDRLVRQGRAFGIHILLGTQTLHGSYSLSRSTLDQMAVRIALQCSDADSRLILSDDNPAAKSLTRPGEAIYNDANGLIEGNNLFQVALFSDEDRLRGLGRIQRFSGNEYESPIIFEGNEPARLEQCRPLKAILHNASLPPKLVKITDVWIGEPTALKPATKVRFRPQSGSNLMVLSRNEDEGIGILTATLFGLVIQQPQNHATYYFVDLIAADNLLSGLPEKLAHLLPHNCEVINRRQIPDFLKKIELEITQRIEKMRGDRPPIYLFFLGLHRARDLRQDNDSYKSENPSDSFGFVLREGPEVGIHTIAWCDSMPNLNRILGRGQLNEFGLRIATAMSADDSSRFLDDGAAARLDKPHRALLYDEELPGMLEKFRPYSFPDLKWIEEVAARLHQKTAQNLNTNTPVTEEPLYSAAMSYQPIHQQNEDDENLLEV